MMWLQIRTGQWTRSNFWMRLSMRCHELRKPGSELLTKKKAETGNTDTRFDNS